MAEGRFVQLQESFEPLWNARVLLRELREQNYTSAAETLEMCRMQGQEV